MTKTTETWEKGTEVFICDGLRTGLFGTVGVVSKRGSIAVCIPGIESHDCLGLCPGGGTYEADYSLLKVTDENREQLKILVKQIELARQEGERTGRENAEREAVELIKKTAPSYISPIGTVYRVSEITLQAIQFKGFKPPESLTNPT